MVCGVWFEWWCVVCGVCVIRLARPVFRSTLPLPKMLDDLVAGDFTRPLILFAATAVVPVALVACCIIPRVRGCKEGCVHHDARHGEQGEPRFNVLTDDLIFFWNECRKTRPL